MQRLLLVVPVSALLLAPGCNNECDFHERCDGSVRQICGDGPDQVVNRKVREEPCEAPSEACVEIDDRTRCVEPPPTECDPESFEGECEDDVLRTCDGFEPGTPHYVTAVDCGLDEKSCAVVDGTAQCG